MILRQLILHLKGADRVDVITEKVDTIGVFTTEGIDIKDGAAHGELSWFIDIIHLSEAETAQGLLYLSDADRLVFLQHQCLRVHVLLRHYHLRQCLRTGDNIPSLP